MYGLGALLLISGALIARSLLSEGQSADPTSALSQASSPAGTQTTIPAGTSASLPTGSQSVTSAPPAPTAAPLTNGVATHVQSSATQQPRSEKTGSSAPSTPKTSTQKTAADTSDLTGSTIVQPDPSVSNAFHFSTATATVPSRTGRGFRQDAARAGNGQLNIPNASSLNPSGRAPRQDVPTVLAEQLPAQALPVHAQASQTPAITLPTRAYVPPAAVPPAYTSPPVQTARPLPVTATPARTTGAQTSTQAFTAAGITAGASPRGAVGTVGSVAPGSPSVTFIPSPTKYTYLGYAESDGDTLAILHLGDRDETVAQGQLIPGTQTQLVSVTPARVTLKTDRIITQVPLEAQP